MKIMRMIKPWGIVKLSIGLLTMGNTHAAEKFYNLTDFINVNKVDAHVHANTKNKTFIELAKKNNFQLISINVDYPDFPAIDEQLKITSDFSNSYPNTLAFASTFSMENWNDKRWSQEVIQRIKESYKNGAIAVKVWKNIGMDYRNSHNQLVMLDDPKFKPIFNFLSEQNIPLIGHQGEPKNCWLPVAEMTVKNDQQYFTEHPQYHMYLHPELPSYEDQMNIRNSVLEAHPKLSFVGAHLASIEWSVDELSKFLDRYPLAVVDTAARMGQIQVQSKRDHNKVRDFFIKYQDRLLYATDLTHQPETPIEASFDQEFSNDVETRWRSDWQYLTNSNEMEVGEIEGSFKGLHLPKKIIDKLYRENALNAFPKAFK